MAGLLDFLNTDDGKLGIALLSAAGPSMQPMSFGQRLQGAMQSMDAGKLEKMKLGLMQSQIDENTAQASERKALSDAKAAELARQTAIQKALPTLYGGGLTGGDAVPQTVGGVPMFGQPMGVTPMQAAPAVFDWQKAARLGMKPEEIEKYAKLPDLGRQEVARTVEVDDGQGGKKTLQLDKFGRPVGDGLAGYIAPVQVNQGDRVTFVKPGAGVTLGVNMSPDAKASNAVAWANNKLEREKFNNTVANQNAPTFHEGMWLTRPTAQNPQGSAVAVPGYTKPLTEFQGKSTTYASRMQDASKVIDDLTKDGGGPSPSAVAAAGYKPNFPSWIPGGQIVGAGLSALNKEFLSPENAQQYRQAQENWVTANLRQESGAAIGKEEMEKDIAKWFPQPGEPKSVIEQKAAARRVAEKAMLTQAGPGAAQVPSIVAAGAKDKPKSHFVWRNGKLEAQ